MSKALERLNDDQKRIAKHTEGNVLVLAGAGSGKALLNGSSVKTPTGDIPIEKLEPGYPVFNTKGEVSKVLGVYPQGEKDVWEVEFSDGIIIECSEDHLWNYSYGCDGYNHENPKTVTTRELFNLEPTMHYNIDNTPSMHLPSLYVPMTEAVQYPKKDLSIDPYLLGVLIANTSFYGEPFKFVSLNVSIFKKISEKLSFFGCNLSKSSKNEYSFSVLNEKKMTPLKEYFNLMFPKEGLSRELFIPHEYKTSSVEDRLELLRALLNIADQYSDSGYSFNFSSEKIAFDTADLARSLGATAKLISNQEYVNYNGKETPKAICYKVLLDVSESLDELIGTEEDSGSLSFEQISGQRTIVRVEKTDRTGEMTCIEVDSHDSLFMTDGYVVTHNTSVLTSRIAYLIEQGVLPWQILSLTFTNKASKEMKERLVSMVGPEARDVWMGTFHSICIRILIRFGSEIGLDTFTLIDDADQKKLIKEVIKTTETSLEEKYILSEISDFKNSLQSPDYVLNNATNSNEESLGHLYMAYEEKKQEHNYIDYDDCIMKTVHLFRVSKAARDVYHSQFKYVLTDETQDTNTAQFELLKHLSAGHHNLFAVGDVDQSIYAFRGAKIENIMKFSNIFPETAVYKLEQNYRSTPVIVNASNAVISGNKNRYDKTSYAMKQGGSNIIIKACDNEKNEAEYLANVINAIKRKGRKYEDVAILYRTNRQSQAIEARFMKESIPYQIVGGQSFADRKEVKDIVAYLRAISSEIDELAFARIINVPKRGIGETTVGRIKDYADECGIPFSKALENIDDVPKVNAKTKLKIKDFSLMIEKLREKSKIENFKVSDFIIRIYKDSGYEESLQENTEENESRKGNIKELVVMGTSWDETSDDDATLSDFLTETSLSADVDKMEDEQGVTMMTVHSSKGLEFPFLFVVGIEEGMFPSGRALGSEEDIEEERRLFYVAMTRAEERLFLSYAINRYDYNNPIPKRTKQSRFLYEIPEEYVRRV